MGTDVQRDGAVGDEPSPLRAVGLRESLSERGRPVPGVQRDGAVGDEPSPLRAVMLRESLSEWGRPVPSVKRPGANKLIQALLDAGLLRRGGRRAGSGLKPRAVWSMDGP